MSLELGRVILSDVPITALASTPLSAASAQMDLLDDPLCVVAASQPNLKLHLHLL